MKILPLLVNNIKFTSNHQYDDLEADNNVHNFLIDDEDDILPEQDIPYEEECQQQEEQK